MSRILCLLAALLLSPLAPQAQDTPAPASGLSAQSPRSDLNDETGADVQSTKGEDAASEGGDVVADEPGESADAASKNKDIEEVLVISKRQEDVERLVSRSVSANAVFKIPSLRDDALASIGTFVGVNLLQGNFNGPPSEGFYFRGGNQADNRFEIDGMEVGYIYHLGGPVSFSVINGRLVERLKFFPSNPDASYQNVNGGVIDVTLKTPPLSGFNQEYDVGALSAGAMIEGALGNSGRDGFWLAVRRSYIDFFLRNTNLREQDPGDSTIVTVTRFPEFFDLQGRWHRELEGGFTDLTFIYSRDESKANFVDPQDPQISGDLGSTQSFAVLGWRYQIEPGTGHLLRSQINYRFPRNEFIIGTQGPEDPNPGQSFDTRVTERVFDINIDHTWQNSSGVFGLRYGFDFSFGRASSGGYFISPPSPDSGVPFISLTSAGSSDIGEKYRTNTQEFFLSLSISPLTGFFIEPGVRTLNAQRRSDLPGSAVDVSSWNGVSPRFHLLYEVSEAVSLYYRWGDYIQLPSAVQLSAGLGNPNELGLPRTRANLLGVNLKSSPGSANSELSVELWHKELTKLVLPDSGICVQCLSNRGKGLAYGLDVEWTFSFGREHNLRLAYGYLFTERRNSPLEPVYPSAADQPHTLKLVYSGPLTRSHQRWRWGVFMSVNSGQPYTPAVDRRFNEFKGEEFVEPVFGASNSRRYPAFLRLNIGFSYTSKSGQSEYRFSVLGAHGLFRNNIIEYSYGEKYENLDSPQGLGEDFVIPTFVFVFRL